VPGLFTALLIEQRLVERECAQVDQMHQQLMFFGVGVRGPRDGYDPDCLVGDLQREAGPAIIEPRARAAVGGDPKLAGRPGAREHDQLATAVDQHDARGDGRLGDGRLGDERLGDAPSDVVELKCPGQRRGQLLPPQPVGYGDLIGGSDAHGPEPGELLDGGQGERLRG
jgi:hypothetical protein